MDFLELNVHQLILTDLAASVGGSSEHGSDPSLDSSINIITSKVTTREISDGKPADDATEVVEKVFMPASRARCNIGFGELAINLPHDLVPSAVPVLLDILRDIPFIDFDHNLTWDDWSLPDQLAYSTISALLQLANNYQDHRNAITEAILKFTSIIVHRIQHENASDVLTHYSPSFHGFYRAVTSTPFSWSLQDWNTLSQHMNVLFSPDVIEHLNRSLVDVFQSDDDDDIDTHHYIQTLISRYVSRGRPLNGYFLVCCVIEAQWTILSQTLCPPGPTPRNTGSAPVEAAAANEAWSALTRHTADESTVVDSAVQASLKATLDLAMQCFSELLVQIEEMESEPSLDTYAWETMSESLLRIYALRRSSKPSVAPLCRLGLLGRMEACLGGVM